MPSMTFYNETFFNDLMHDSARATDLKIEIFMNHFDNYQDNQFQSARLDSYLGFKCNQIEANLRHAAREMYGAGSIEKLSYARDNSLTWIGLNPAQLQTPYGEFVELLARIDITKYSSVIDLGAGYGRLGIIIGLFYPNIKFTGIELVKERVDEGNRIYSKLDIRNAVLRNAHINKSFEKSDLYFIYDYGDKNEMIQTIDLLSQLADQNHSFSVVARGSAINALIRKQAPWILQSNISLENSTLYSFNL
jgi:SAM-dependent methyltransferase